MTLDCTPQALVTTAAPMQAVPDGYQGALLLSLFCVLAGVTADPQRLVTEAKCLECGLDGMEDLVIINLLAGIAGVSADPTTLANDARCVDCNVPAGFKMDVLLSVACLMAQNGPITINDPDVQAFIDAAGITDQPTIDALNKLVGDLKGGVGAAVWSGFDAIYPFVGGTANKCSYNLKAPANYQITWHGAMTFDANGITGDEATGYGDTGFNPATVAGSQYSLNSASLGVYLRNAGADARALLSGGDGVQSASLMVGLVFGSFVSQGKLNNANAASSPASANFNGSMVASRLVSNLVTIYAPDTATGTNAVATTALPNANLFLSANNNAGTANLFSNNPMAFAFIGRGFTAGEVATIKSAILTFETTLGRA